MYICMHDFQLNSLATASMSTYVRGCFDLQPHLVVAAFMISTSTLQDADELLIHNRNAFEELLGHRSPLQAAKKNLHRSRAVTA